MSVQAMDLQVVLLRFVHIFGEHMRAHHVLQNSGASHEVQTVISVSILMHATNPFPNMIGVIIVLRRTPGQVTKVQMFDVVQIVLLYLTHNFHISNVNISHRIIPGMNMKFQTTDVMQVHLDTSHIYVHECSL